MDYLQDTDTHETTDTGHNVEAMRSLIEDTDLTEDAPRGALKTELIERAELLAGRMEWTLDEFLEHAGCSSAGLVIEGKPSIDFLLACLSYLIWVDELTADLDLLVDRRMAVRLSARLFRNGGRDLDACRGAMDVTVDASELSAAEYLSLGEVTRAFQVAIARLDTAEGRRLASALLQDPLYLCSPHVVDDRIELAWIEPKVLGEETAKRVRTHVIGCSACAASYEQKLA